MSYLLFMVIRVFAALAACLLFGMGAADVVSARSPSRKKAIWGPAQVNGHSQFPIYHDLGVGIYQQQLNWNSVATKKPADARNPADPAYVWPADLDLAVKEGKRYGIRISLMLFGTPAWANGSRTYNYPPKRTADLADFAKAVARRYPSIHLWMVWGEPIRQVNFFFDPQGTPNYYAPPPYPKPKPVSRRFKKQEQQYALMLDAVYGTLKSISKKNLIIGGNTTTSGDVDPEDWIKNLRLPNGKPPRMDLYGHNPFGVRHPDLKAKQLAPGTADFSDLDVLARWLDRYLAMKGRNKHLPIFISEYTAPTDVPSYEFPFHLTRKAQARWLTDGLRIARRWSRIYTFGWIGLRDSPPNADGVESRTGLIDKHGVRKASYYAFRRS